MAEVTVFSDRSCANKIVAKYVEDSGHNDGKEGSNAFDGDSTTHWRPQCGECRTKEAWVTFSTTKEAQCVKAENLGFINGEHYWNGGISVEIQNSGGTWTTAIESDDGGNSAIVAAGISLNLVFKRDYVFYLNQFRGIY